MTKTPDEIKKGLECCSEDGCKKCHYWEYCKMADGFSELAGDALDLIQQLEAERDTLMHYLHIMGCDTCLFEDYSGLEPPCINCTAERDLWQFKGVQKEE